MKQEYSTKKPQDKDLHFKNTEWIENVQWIARSFDLNTAEVERSLERLVTEEWRAAEALEDLGIKVDRYDTRWHRRLARWWESKQMGY